MAPASRQSTTGNDLLLLLAQSLDAEMNPVTGTQESGGFLAHPHTGRRTRADDVARLQGHELADVVNQETRAPYHGRGRTFLIAAIVYVKPQTQSLRIRNFVGGYKPRTDRTKRIAILALLPFPTPFHLKTTFRTRLPHPLTAHHSYSSDSPPPHHHPT